MTRGTQDRFARVVSAGLRSAAFSYAVLTLLLAWFTEALALMGFNSVGRLFLPGVGTLLAIAGVLLLALRARPRLRLPKVVLAFVLLQVGYLVYIATVHPNPATGSTTASFALSLFRTALIAASVNAGRRWGPALVATLSLVVSGLTSAFVGPLVGFSWAPDGTSIAALIFMLITSVGFAIARRRGAAARKAVAEVRDQDRTRQARAVVRTRAAAVVHDTVLNDLAVLATSEPGRLTPRLTERLASTLELLASPDWVQGGDPALSDEAGGTTVQRSIDRVTALGLVVESSGEFAALSRIDPAIEHELGRAVEQCLVNTLRHAGTGQAEVMVLAEEDGVSVMVVDTGNGFDPDDIEDDRLGLRGSVMSRIEDIGGSVRVFATPGVGTTILLSVPRGDAEQQTLDESSATRAG